MRRESGGEPSLPYALIMPYIAVWFFWLQQEKKYFFFRICLLIKLDAYLFWVYTESIKAEIKMEHRSFLHNKGR